MGNICSKSANEDHFSGAGRTLGGSADDSAPVRVPAPQKQKLNAAPPGRTLGSRDGVDGPTDAREAAALAAQQRAEQSSRSGGRLATNLAAQKRQTQNQTLQAQSANERMARTADENAQTRNYN